MDVEDIAPGQNFVETIDRSIAACDTALIVIGTRWIPMLLERSQGPERDYVSHEVSSALAHKLRVVPVLVGGATMPREADLPPALSGLALHQAAELRDATFREDAQRLISSLGITPASTSPRRKWLFPAVGAVAVMAFIGLWGLLPRSKAALDPRLATARTQTELGEHESAFRTYQEVLKTGPSNPAILTLQADAAMAWLRNFHVVSREGQKAEEIAGPPLTEIIRVLEAALSSTAATGQRTGDVLAHLGWAHWLNERIAQKEFGSAERYFRRALTADPKNVFAHAMLGNWLLQTSGDASDALRHLEAAEKTNEQRPLLRQMQLGGMVSNSDPAISPALMRVVNQMRVNGEPLASRYRSRVMSYFRPGNSAEVRQMLAAVPADDAWATFLWLDDPTPRDERNYENFRREFIHALVLDLDHKPAEALAILADLGGRMRSAGMSGRLVDDVSRAATRLRSNSPQPAH